MKQKVPSREIARQKNALITKLAVAAKQAKESGGKPFIFHFLTTLRCNCDCESCLWKDNSAKDELSLQEIKRIYLEARKAGFFITLRGHRGVLRGSPRSRFWFYRDGNQRLSYS